MAASQNAGGVAGLTARWADLVLEEEEAAFMPTGDAEDGSGGSDAVEEVWTVVGRFLTRKLGKLEFMSQVMASVWQPVPDGISPCDVELDSVDLWIQLHGLPKGNGVKGGIALLWQRNNTASLLSYSDNHVDIEHEKRGGNPHPDSLLRGFGVAIEKYGLSQMAMQGYPLTWERGKGTADWIEERLDKVLVSDEWREIVAGARVSNLLTRRSDHSAIFLSTHDSVGRGGASKRGFRFENAWLYDEGCRGVVEKACEEGKDRGLQNCIEFRGSLLSRWGGDRFHKFREQIMNLRKEQLRLRGKTDPVSLTEFRRLEERLCRTKTQEDAFWRQRAKQHWLKGKPMRGIILQYFQNIFASGNSENGENFFNNITPRVTPAQNESLIRHFTMDEVKVALFSMYPDKAPGPDGMNPGFYQHFWDVVGGDVSSFIVNCLENCCFPDTLNETDVVLIPKKQTPKRVSDLRPIALSNVIYSVMAKVMTNRMKPLMDEIISDSQSAFIPDRLITDNILIASEVGHYLHRKQCGTVGWAALKLDMAKSYDLTPTRGIRQGDPFSPYLFIICAEGLSANLQEAGVIKECLTAYENLSGQAVNYHKSSICYSKSTTEENRDMVAQALGVVQAPNFGKYLGLPSFIGRNRKAAFSYIEEKIKQRVGSWNKKLLSQAELRAFNLAMLGKQACRLLTKPESLVARVYKARYYPKDTFSEAYLGNNPSFCWRSIMAAKSMVCSGVWRRIGNGQDTRIWDHPWLQDEQEPMIQTEMPPQLANARVAGLIDQDTGTWDASILSDIFVPEDLSRIMKIPVSPEYEDTWYWHDDPRGIYSVKSGYRCIVG
ncbi:PREDICTED: uncharacterized protein LOC109192130 [Ipomoea nil]|uniref:uncharacterized protein LOC109192130 n=1 Tax=Ipomoea nil TaxID=35883 RepID=UPI0009019B52|nr:PREDICTED: uncharacterized protein LOC109192130 [Ipomoea nil]